MKARSRQIDSQTIEFIPDGELLSDQKLIVRVVFPSDILDVPVPKWQKIEQKRPQNKSSNADWSWLFYLLFFLLLALLKKGGAEIGIGGDGGDGGGE